MHVLSVQKCIVLHMHSTNANYKHDDDDDDDDDDNNDRIKMAGHTMQLAGKREVLQISKETENSTQRDKKKKKNTSNTHITRRLKPIC